MVSRIVWRLFCGICAVVLKIAPASSAEREAIRTLRAEVAALPPIADPDRSSAHPIWIAGRKRLRELILSRDPRGFLTWDIVAQTMFPRFGTFVREELKLLRKSDWNTVWRRALDEPRFGCPFPALVYPSSSTNTIHHAYHLCRFELDTSSRVSDYALALEFGGGYGSLCRLFHTIGFRGKYIIFDFPEQSALQHYYLSLTGLTGITTISDVNLLAQAVSLASKGPRLFIATWSLSESELAIRRQIAEIVHSFDGFLIAYQEQFPGIDNCAYFLEWRKSFPDVIWTETTIVHLPGNRYLFGRTKSLFPA